MAEEWVGFVHQASAKYSKIITDLTVRHQLALRLLERRGNINLGVDGSYETIYPVDWKDAPITSLGYGGQASYSPRDYTKTATIEWRGYLTTDMMHIKEQSELGGSTARFVDRYKRIVPKQLKGMRKKIGLEIYTDGGANGNQDRFCGLETFCNADVTATTGTDADDLIAKPDDTYNGLDTDAGTAGSWSTAMGTGNFPNDAIATDWPEGTGDVEYDYWTPKLVNWSSTSWPSGASNAWSDTGAYVLRRTIQWLQQTAGMDGNTLLVMLSGALMTDFKNAQEAKIRTIAQHPEARDLGFPEVLEYDGAMLKTEYGVPADTGYVFNMDEVSLEILDKEFITTRGPLLDPDSLAYKWFAYTFGNYKFIPKFCAKLKNFA